MARAFLAMCVFVASTALAVSLVTPCLPRACIMLYDPLCVTYRNSAGHTISRTLSNSCFADVEICEMERRGYTEVRRRRGVCMDNSY